MGQHGAKWPEWRMQPAEPQPARGVPLWVRIAVSAAIFAALMWVAKSSGSVSGSTAIELGANGHCDRFPRSPSMVDRPRRDGPRVSPRVRKYLVVSTIQSCEIRA